MAAFQWFQALNARSNYQSIFSIGVFSNRYLLLGVGAAILLQLGAVYTAVGQMVFGTPGISWADWLWIAMVSSTIWVADEMLKRLEVYGNPHSIQDDSKRGWSDSPYIVGRGDECNLPCLRCGISRNDMVQTAISFLGNGRSKT